jgi:hypothetical protein
MYQVSNKFVASFGDDGTITLKPASRLHPLHIAQIFTDAISAVKVDVSAGFVQVAGGDVCTLFTKKTETHEYAYIPGLRFPVSDEQHVVAIHLWNAPTGKVNCEIILAKTVSTTATNASESFTDERF